MNVDLNRRCRIEYPVKGKDPVHGSAITTWTLKDVVWCNIQDVLPSRAEAVKNGVAIGAKQTRFRVRYRTDLDSSMKVIIDGNTYQIITDFAEFGKKEYSEAMIERYTS
jgi:SPP1 family predicted phage head-tail adaptor